MGNGIGENGCKDKDECVVDNPCSAAANCSNAEGTFSCSCNSGFAGTGIGEDGCTIQNGTQQAVLLTTVIEGAGVSANSVNRTKLQEELDGIFNPVPGVTGVSIISVRSVSLALHTFVKVFY